MNNSDIVDIDSDIEEDDDNYINNDCNNSTDEIRKARKAQHERDVEKARDDLAALSKMHCAAQQQLQHRRMVFREQFALRREFSRVE